MSYRFFQKTLSQTLINSQKRKLHIPKVEEAGKLNKTLKNERILAYGSTLFLLTAGLFLMWRSEQPGSDPFLYYVWDEKPLLFQRRVRRVFWSCTECGFFERECQKACKQAEREKKEAYYKLTAGKA